MSKNEVRGWVWPSNVRSLLTHISRYVGYAFDDTDWEAIESGLPGTDADLPDAFYEYPIVGRSVLVVRLARHVGADPVDVQVEGSMGRVLRARVETLLDILADVHEAP